MTVVASNFERKANELYETEAWATRALLQFYPVKGMIVWEPSAGNHKMVDVLAECGARVLPSDIETYSRRHAWEADFFGEPTQISCDAIVTNPPYGKQNRIAAAYARLALQRCGGMVALLLTAKFDFGKTRRDLFQDNPRFAAKIALVDRIQWFPGDTTGTEDHAWYVWGPATPGKPVLLYAGRDA